jgi:hypothetical protein
MLPLQTGKPLFEKRYITSPGYLIDDSPSHGVKVGKVLLSGATPSG